MCCKDIMVAYRTLIRTFRRTGTSAQTIIPATEKKKKRTTELAKS